jgi:hypothetical protein
MLATLVATTPMIAVGLLFIRALRRRAITGAGRDRIAQVTQWLHQHRVVGFVLPALILVGYTIKSFIGAMGSSSATVVIGQLSLGVVSLAALGVLVELWRWPAPGLDNRE